MRSPSSGFLCAHDTDVFEDLRLVISQNVRSLGLSAGLLRLDSGNAVWAEIPPERYGVLFSVGPTRRHRMWAWSRAGRVKLNAWLSWCCQLSLCLSYTFSFVISKSLTGRYWVGQNVRSGFPKYATRMKFLPSPISWDCKYPVTPQMLTHLS